MYRIVIYVLFWFLLLPWAFLNYGQFIDTTEVPKKSDIVVCLGGGTKERVNKSIKLLQEGYARQFILLGESWYNQPYIHKNYPKVSVFIDEAPKNTKEEVLYIKSYMLKHGYKTALVVTDPPHSRRVSVLNSVLSVKGDSDLVLRMVSSEVKWWKVKKYYDDERSGETALSETMGILYSILCYGVVEKLGVSCD